MCYVIHHIAMRDFASLAFDLAPLRRYAAGSVRHRSQLRARLSAAGGMRDLEESNSAHGI
jgi:hypothetical protein